MLSTVGALMVATSIFGLTATSRKARLKRSIRRYLEATKLSPHVKLRKCRQRGNCFVTEFTLPYGLRIEKFQEHVSGLEQATASKIRFRHLFGSTCELTFGFYPFHERMNYSDRLPKDGLAIPLYTPFGLKTLDFRDETCCHLLCGGATRMGKSAFLRYITTHLIDATGGEVDITFIDHKITDLYMFLDLPQVKIAETSSEARVYLKDVLAEITRRKNLLKSRRNVVDLNEFRKKYPNESVKPMFVIIDEYGRFSDDSVIQDAVTEIAETAGYVDIHLIISSQRPDAKDVLKPRIKANIVTRISFATYDEVNSKIILDIPDAAHIGKIQGRAILVDGFPELVQVPYLSPSQALQILKPYRSGVHDETRPDDIEVPEALSSAVERSDCSASLSGSRASVCDDESNHEASNARRVRTADSTNKEPTIPIHAESGDYTSSIEQNRAFPWLSGHILDDEEAENF